MLNESRSDMVIEMLNTWPRTVEDACVVAALVTHRLWRKQALDFGSVP
jgi:hypothetical protein